MRALQAFLPIPFLAVGGLLFLSGPTDPDVVVIQSGDHYETTTTHHVDSTTTTEGQPTTLPTTSTVPQTTTPREVTTTVDHKITICHLPPGNPPNFQIISIDLSALPAHLAHGDIYPVPADGICFTPPTTMPVTSVSINPVTVLPGSTTTTLPGTTTSTTTTSTLPGTTTTTQAGTATSVAPIDSFDIGGASSVCSRDVPFIDITFGNEPQFNGLVGTITFSTLDGDFIEEIPVTYQANTTVRLVFPGASFDPVTGEATDWPGWVLNADGFWVTDPTDAEFRDGIVITASLPAPVGGLGQSRLLQQVSASTTVTYPPETAACNSPTGPFPPSGPGNQTQGSSGVLPVTGPQALGLMLLAIGIATGLGNAFVQIGRKNGNA